jgi:hypothetical protein
MKFGTVSFLSAVPTLILVFQGCGNSDTSAAAGGSAGQPISEDTSSGGKSGAAGKSAGGPLGGGGKIGKGGSPGSSGSSGAPAGGSGGASGASGMSGASGGAGGAGAAGAAGAPGAKPNILFVIMDDVGIDQMAAFGYGGTNPPAMPTIGQVADSGVRFSNNWSMPACSTSRAVFFDGRYPIRTNVYAALGPNDLANSMVSPFETTAPKLMAKAGYKSALFGKFHLALPGKWPGDSTAKNSMPRALGWDYFYGWLDATGDPSSIDKTPGGVPGTWPCGFVAGSSDKSGLGADTGACYKPDGTCMNLSTSGDVPPGRTCRDSGGLLDPKATCQATAPANITAGFSKLSAHFVSPLVINNEDGTVEAVPATDPRARKFRATSAVDSAISWIKKQPPSQPWMASVSFASAHTPVMQPPVNEEPAGTKSSKLDCSNLADQRTLTNLMISSLDAGVSRLLVETGLATMGAGGKLVYSPTMTNTMVVIVGDNGSLGNSVKSPFDPTRAKGTAYQTGVWVPLIVAGPLVKSPSRAVTSMTNIADIFQLFGEIAGLDVHKTVGRDIDSQPMLPYLTDPKQASIRTTNFTQIGHALQLGGGVNGPCLIGNGCTHIPVSKSVCEDNNGCWYGEGYDGTNCPTTTGTGNGTAPPFKRCCETVSYLTSLNVSGLTISPDVSTAVRNDKYKVVQNRTLAYVDPANPCVDTTTTEFYAIDEGKPTPKLDTQGADLKAPGMPPLTAEQQSNYDALNTELAARLATAPSCPGDGNIDGTVSQQDLTDLMSYLGPQSSVYDLNLDGATDAADQSIIQANLGKTCATVGQSNP